MAVSINLLGWVNYTKSMAPAGLIDRSVDVDLNAPACFYRLRWP